jgi:lysophospholipase L1-like esterase
VERYADHVSTDTGARVDVTNLGRSGQTSSQLLDTLSEDRSVRRRLRAAEIITFNIGINDLGRAGAAHENGACGGTDNERCLRAAVERVKGNWDDIIAEILSLRSTDEAVIRTAGLGYTPRVDEVFEPYLSEVEHHIATTAAENGIPSAQPYLAGGYMSPDGLHPNDDGYEVMAQRLRELGYRPLEQ